MSDVTHNMTPPARVDRVAAALSAERTEATERRPLGRSVGRFVGGCAARWRRAWFAPLPAWNFAVFRSGLGALSFLWFLTLLPDLVTFLGSNGLEPEPVDPVVSFSIFRFFSSDIALWVGALIGTLASALMIIGRFTRVAGPVVAVIVTSLMGETSTIWNAGDELLQTFALLFGFFCLLTPSSDLDVSLRSCWHDMRPLRVGRLWLFRLIQIQMTLIYLVTFLEKSAGGPWRDGTAVMTVLRLETMDRFVVPDVLATNLFLGNLLTWGALLIEGLLPIVLWHRRARPYAVATAIVFHLAIEWSLLIGLFSWIMILGLLTFVEPEGVRRTVRRLGRLVPNRPERSWNHG